VRVSDGSAFTTTIPYRLVGPESDDENQRRGRTAR
jgi:hypothetical protein